jgi:hypothetical protein
MIPETGFHLLLSHLLEHDDYLEFYKWRRTEGDYLVLDNSAHEFGAAQDHELLLRNAKALGAQEVVLPDVLFDRRGTLERTKRMLKWLISPEGWEVYQDSGMPRFMLVPQGNDRADWVQCLNQLLLLWDNYTYMTPTPIEEPVVGISKDYDNWRGGLTYLIGHYVAPLRVDRSFDVHCLGWPNNLWSLAHVHRHFPWVRSTDSAKPFVYAKADILLEPGGDIPKYPRRDENYFTERLELSMWEKAERNVEVFRASATDELVLTA